LTPLKHARLPRVLLCEIWSILVKHYQRAYEDPPEMGPSRPAFQGHSRSLEPARIGQLPVTSCQWSRVTMDLSRTVTEINGDFGRTSTCI